jgi:hypothetical protein
MRDDLIKEKKVTLKQWAKREQQIHRVIESTTSFWGGLQGIVGSSSQEIKELEWDGDGEPAALPAQPGYSPQKACRIRSDLFPGPSTHGISAEQSNIRVPRPASMRKLTDASQGEIVKLYLCDKNLPVAVQPATK